LSADFRLPVPGRLKLLFYCFPLVFFDIRGVDILFQRADGLPADTVLHQAI